MDEQESEDIINELIEKKIIVHYIPNNKRYQEGIGGMFKAPIVDIRDVLSIDCFDVVFLGFPYDLSVTYKSGCRFASRYLRSESNAIFQYNIVDGKPAGMWNCVEKRWVLKGVSLVDCGDISGIIFERNGKEFEYLHNIVKQLVYQKKFPVIIGGDHSISLATILGSADALESIGVIHFDAHNDIGSTQIIDWKKSCHHGNFMGWIVNNPKVKIVAQSGIRQLCVDKYESEKVKSWDTKSVVNNLDKILLEMPMNIPYFTVLD